MCKSIKNAKNKGKIFHFSCGIAGEKIILCVEDLLQTDYNTQSEKIAAEKRKRFFPQQKRKDRNKKEVVHK